MIDGALKPIVETTQLTNAAAKLYTVPSGVTKVVSIFVCNVDTANHTFTIHNVAKGGSATAANKIMPEIPIIAKRVYGSATDQPCLWAMVTGGELWALADANSVVNLTVGGIEIPGPQ